MDLSNEVFCPGMAYVVLSWVKCLDNLYLTTFTIGKQSRSVLKSMFGGDQLFDKIIPFRSSTVKVLLKKRKRALTGVLQSNVPPSKHTGVSKKSTSGCSKGDEFQYLQKESLRDVHLLVYIRTRNEIPSRYRYNPVTSEWQQLLDLQFVCDNECTPGVSDVSLTYTVEPFSAYKVFIPHTIVYAITGSQSQHYRLRSLIIAHLRSLTDTEQELRLHGSLIGTVEEYIVHSKTDCTYAHSSALIGSAIQLPHNHLH